MLFFFGHLMFKENGLQALPPAANAPVTPESRGRRRCSSLLPREEHSVDIFLRCALHVCGVPVRSGVYTTNVLYVLYS